MSQPRRILIVEDEGISAHYLEQVLADSGYQSVGVAASAARALELARALSPDLVIMDIQLKGEVDGIDAALQIRRSLNIPVIFLTAYLDAVSVQRALLSEPYGCLSKPVQVEFLLSTIEIALANHRIETELRMKDAALASSINAVLIADPQGGVVYANAALLRLRGVQTLEEVLGKPVLDIFGDEPAAHEAYTRVSNEGSWVGELTALRTDGKRLNVQVSASLVAGPERQPARLFISLVDISERVEVGLRLRESEAYFQALFHRSPVAYLMMDRDGVILQANQANASFSGYALAEVLGTHFTRYIDPNDRAGDAAVFQQLLVEQRSELTFEKRFFRKDGGVIWGRFSVSLVMLAGKQSEYVLVACEDVTARRNAEEALRESEDRLRLITNSLPGVVYVFYKDQNNRNRLSYISDGVQALLGVSPEEVMANGDIFWSRIHPEDIPGVVEAFQKSAAANSAWVAEYRYEMPDGQYKWIRGSSIPMQDPILAQKIYIGVATDISPLKETQARLQLALEAKDALLYEVHHRIKNNLQVVISLLNMQAGTIADEKVQAIFDDSCNRIAAMSLVHQTLYQSMDVERIHFPAFLRQLCHYLLASFSMEERVRIEADAEDITLDVDRGIICALIANELISNALKYAFPAPRMGLITIRLRWQEDMIELAVIDNGVGLPDGFVLGRTRTMGLHLVKILSEQLYGSLGYETHNGAHFRILFAVT